MKTWSSGTCCWLIIAFGILTGTKATAQLKADFTSNVQSGCAPLIIAFEDKSTGNPNEWVWNLGNGTMSNRQNPITTYSDAGTYMVKLVAKNSAGKDSITKTTYITVYNNPTVGFDATTLTGCYPLKVDFKNSSKAGSGTIAEYLWDLGDGNANNAANVSHTYVSAGVYDITLKVTNSFGCYTALTKSDLIHINDGATAAFNLKSFNVCSTPATAAFNNLSAGSGALTYSWNFGDGVTSSEESPSHNYNASGDYNVLLKVTSSSGCSDTATMKISTNLPAPSITLTGATCLNQSIQFTNSSVPAPVSNIWYFSDGTTSTDLNPVKTFDNTGSYTVKLINKFSTACTDSASKAISIATSPTADFTADDTAKCATPATISFTNKTVGAASSYVWDFGDGGTATSANTPHIYTKPGVYNVQLTALNANGCKSVLTKPAYINLAPLKILRINGLPDSGCAPFAVKPQAILSKGKGIKYNWDFGDGNTSTLELPSHNYTKEGVYVLKVSVITDDGCSADFILPNAVLVGHKPKANFVSDKDSICINDVERFTSTSTNGPITAFRWDFGPSMDPVAGQHYTRNPSDTGYQRIYLIAYNAGCADTTLKDSVTYVMPPVAKLIYQMNCDNKEKVDFTDKSVGNVTRTWDFGDGATSTAEAISHIYSKPGLYNVKLNVTNKGCYDTRQAQVLVIDEKANIKLDTTIYCNGNSVDPEITGANQNNIKNVTWNFGDGIAETNTSSLSTNHIYATTGKYKLTAVMIDKNACEYDYAVKDSIKVYGPVASFVALQTGVCLGSNVLFSDKSTTDTIHKIAKWSWNYGDTSVDYTTAGPFNHLYKDTGNYTVRIKITDSYGCSDSLKRTNYIIISKPYAQFTISDSVACPGKKIEFTNTSAGRALSYKWVFGDGGESTDENPVYNFKGSGVYKPVLYATDVNGCKDTAQAGSLSVAKTVAKFLMSDSVSTCPPLQVNFTNNSTDYKNSTWDFGDGSPSVISSPTHIYTYPGIYVVKLKVNGFGTCNDSIKGNIVIKGPTGSIKYNAKPICYPDTTKFSAVATNTVLYTWDFSDGNTAQTKTNFGAHVYEGGKYLPKMILQDVSGCKVSIKGIDSVTVYNITANAWSSATAVCDSTPIQFKDLSTSPDAIVHHYWLFGDGNSADAKEGAHKYTSPGSYNVRLVSETKTGCKDSFSFASAIAVLQAPHISILGDDAVCASSSANFNGASVVADNTIQWQWDMGNGETLTGEKASSLYKKAGNYTVKCKAINAGGCFDSSTKNIVVHAPPVVTAGNDTTICKSAAFSLHANGAAVYNWSGEGMSCTDCSAPSVNPAVKSTYYVTGKDAIGCAGTDSVAISVIEPSKITVSNNDTLCMGETVQFHATGASAYKWFPSTYLNNNNTDGPVYTAARDTSITFKVIGYTEKNCFADTGYVSVKTYPKPQLNITQSEIGLSVGSSVQLNAVSSADVTQFRWQPPQGLNNAAIANPIASPRQTTKYSVVASNGGNCVARDEIIVTVTCGNNNVFIPNTFSPNNDGVNDQFYTRGNGLFKIKSFRIFNRWGQIVFEKYNSTPNNAADGWDGSMNGKPAQSDVYVYVIEVLCENNMVIPFKGNITLIR